MKAIINIFSLSILLSFLSCEPNILFEQPMPPVAKSIEFIPDDLIGVFTWEEDESYLLIDQKFIYQETWYKSRMSIEEVRETETCNILDGGIYHNEMEDCIPFEYIDEDSIISTIVQVDTLFNFSNHQHAKMMNGKLFLNYENEQGLWASHILNPQQDGSIIWEIIQIPHGEELPLYAIKDQRKYLGQDSTYKYIVNPTQEEFLQLIKNENTSRLVKLVPLNFESGLENAKLIY